MNNAASRLVGCEFPLFAFTHCRDVVVAVSKAGGFGVLGASSFTPEQLEIELQWIDQHIQGHPYGVDILVPEHQALKADQVVTPASLAARIPERHIEFTLNLLQGHDIHATAADLMPQSLPGMIPEVGTALMDVAFRHPIRLIANALGIAPAGMIERARHHGVPVAALVGAKEHALRQAHAGVDLIVAQGSEAGGHCGEVSTLVLVPEVLDALATAGHAALPVLAAGGIMNGRQMAGCMAMGAAGAWTGTVWLATTEAETTPEIRTKMLSASSRDTIRSAARTGKPSRQLHSAWHDAWHGPDSPGILPMPLMSLLAQPAFRKIEQSSRTNPKAFDLLSYWVGQGVGLVHDVVGAGTVVEDFMRGFADAVELLNQQMEA